MRLKIALICSCLAVSQCLYLFRLPTRSLLAAIDRLTLRFVPVSEHNEQNQRSSATQEFLESVESAFSTSSFARLKLIGRKLPNAKAFVAPEGVDELRLDLLKQVEFKLVSIKRAIKVQAVYTYPTNTITKNYDEEGCLDLVTRLLAVMQSAILTTTDTDRIELSLDRVPARLKRLESTQSTQLQKQIQESILSKAAIEPHDRPKKHLIDSTEPFLASLGITTSTGKPLTNMSHKLRQVQKFTEIMDNLIRKVAGNDVNTKRIRIVDMGSGLGYLTFAIHSHLTSITDDPQGIQSIGIELRPALVNKTESLARSLGHRYSGLQFVQGSIAEQIELTQRKEESDIHVLIALHACDTATDDAIYMGIRNQADVIVVAPCCHKEIRNQIEMFVGSYKSNLPPALEHFRYGIYRERCTEMITDSLRAMILEQEGYAVTVAEFVGGEHTAKNVMISAVRRTLDSVTPETKETMKARAIDVMSSYGIRRQRLAKWLGFENINASIPIPSSDKSGTSLRIDQTSDQSYKSNTGDIKVRVRNMKGINEL